MKNISILFLFASFISTSLVGQCGDECTDAALTFFTGTSPDGALYLDDCQIFSCPSGDLNPESINNPCGFDISPTFWVDVYTDNVAEMLYVEVQNEGQPANVSIAIYDGDCGVLNLNHFFIEGIRISCSQDDGAINRIHMPLYPGNSGVFHVAISVLDFNPDDQLSVCVGTASSTYYCDSKAEPIGSNYQCDPKTEFNVSERSFTDKIDSDGDGTPGPFCPNEEIRVWMTYQFDTESSGNGWLQGIIPMMNDNFLPVNPEAVEFNFPGQQWFEEGIPFATQIISRLCTYRDRYGILQICNDLCESCPCYGPTAFEAILPGGWFWLSEGGGGCGNYGEPSSMYGIEDGNNIVLDFYIDVTVREFVDIVNCPTNKNLKFGFQPLTDGLTGCWQDPTANCNILPAQTIQYEIDCNLPEQPMVSQLLQSINSRDSVDIYVEAPLPYLFVEVVPIENENIDGATEQYKEANYTVNDKLVNLTDEIQIQQYIVRTRDEDIVCPSLQDTISIEVGKNAGLEAVQYQIRYNAEYNWYDCYLIIKEGFANTPAQLTQFITQYSLALDAGTSIEIVENYNPVTVNGQIKEWNISTSVMSPSSGPDFDFYAITPSLSPTGYYNPIEEGDSIRLFSLKVNHGPDCKVPIRLFENGVDPGPGAPGMGGGDFSQHFTLGGFEEKYDSNIQAEVPTGNVPIVTIAGANEIWVGSTTQLYPKTGGTWASADNNIATINNEGLVTGVAAGTATFTYTESSSGCISDPTETVTVFDCQGVEAVLYQIRYNAQYDWYDCYMVVKDGCASTPQTLAQFNANYSLVLPTGVTYSIDSLYAPIRSDNGAPMNWMMNEQVISPAAQPENDFHTIIPELSPIGYYDSPLYEGDSVKLFSVSVSPNISCLEPIRLFENGVDPASSAPGMGSADYSQGFTLGGFIQIYDSNLPGIDIQSNVPVASIVGDSIIVLSGTTELSPNTGGTWISDNPAVVTVTNSGIVTGVSYGCATLLFTSSVANCQSNRVEVCVSQDSFPQFEDNGLCLGESTVILNYENYTFEADPPDIISIDNNGVVTTLNPGTVTVQVTGPNSYSSVIGLTVYELPNISFGPYGPVCIDDPLLQLQGSPNGGTFSGVGVSGGQFSPSDAALGVHTFYYEYTDGQGCSNTASTEIEVLDIPITSILGNDTISILGTTQVSPSTGGTWTSDNPTIVSVTNSGLVTGLFYGCVTLQFTSSIGSCQSNTGLICVLQDSFPQLQDDKICVGSSTQILFYENYTFEEDSANPAGLSIDNEGVIICLNIGVFKIIVTGAMGYTDTLTVTVNDLPNLDAGTYGPVCVDASRITLSGTPAGGTWSGTGVTGNEFDPTSAGVGAHAITYEYTDGNSCENTAVTQIVVNNIPTATIDGADTINLGEITFVSPTTGGTWVSDNNLILTITNAGLVTGVSVGCANVIFTEFVNGCQSQPLLICVVQDAIPQLQDDMLCVSEMTQITNFENYTFISSNTSVVTVNSDGKVTAVGSGTAQIAVEGANGYMDILTITVNPSPVATLLGPDTIGIGGTTTVSPSTGGTWISADDNIFTITDGGLVTGVDLGCTVVVFTDVENECSSNPLTICVNKIDVPYLDKQEICIGDNAQIINYDDYDFNVLTPNIITLSNSGLITGFMGGTTDIEVTGPNGYSDVLNIVVNASPVITLTGPDSILVGNTTSFTPTSGGFWVSNNNSIATISNAGIVTGVGPGTVTFSFIDNNGCIAISEVITVYEIDSPVLCGTVYMDDNENDTFDIGELTLTNFKVIDPINNMTYFTDANGQYSFEVKSSAQPIIVEATYGLWNDSVVNATAIIIAEKTILNFGFVTAEIISDANITMTSGLLRCNTFAELTVAATNTGTSTLSGTLTVDLDPTISYTEFNPQPISQVGSSYVFEYADLTPGNSFEPYIRIGVPPFFPSQDSLRFSALMKNDAGNDLIEKEYIDVIRCSHDPNDKRVFPDRPGDENHILAGETVEYIIRFQNNGNDTAFYVEVVDVISNTLDIGTLKIMEASHDMTTEIHGDTAFFKFYNILLVDSMTNYEASQGFVAFSIVTMKDLQPEDLVNNTANIIFDKNDPIITNTITNTVVDILPCYDLSSDITRVENTLFGAPNGSQYIWVDCEDLDTIFTSSTNDFTPEFSGLYQLILNGESCQNISDCYSFIISDIIDLESIDISLYPNPTDGMLYIKSKQAVSKISILRTDGSIVTQLAGAESIDMSTYPAGVYTIRLEISNQLYHHLILVK